MIMLYKPKKAGLARCAIRPADQLQSAAELLGHTLVFGSELSYELQVTGDNPPHLFHQVGQRNSQTFVLLQGMLIAERWLIEFLLGPSLEKGQKRQTDICVDCFVHDWRFPKSGVANELAERRQRINRLVLHPTWELVDNSPRNWTLNRIGRCIEGVEMFAERIEQASVAEVLNRHVRSAKMALKSGRSDGLRWLALVPHVVPVQSSPGPTAM
jgi:hypothetical protein